jgi:hypothetical protein
MEQQNDNQKAAGNEQNQPPLTTKADAAGQEENFGGTTNLSLDQLKNEGSTASFTDDNPDHIADADDLHEVQVSDDLEEPDPETELPPTDPAAENVENENA